MKENILKELFKVLETIANNDSGFEENNYVDERTEAEQLHKVKGQAKSCVEKYRSSVEDKSIININLKREDLINIILDLENYINKRVGHQALIGFAKVDGDELIFNMDKLKNAEDKFLYRFYNLYKSLKYKENIDPKASRYENSSVDESPYSEIKNNLISYINDYKLSFGSCADDKLIKFLSNEVLTIEEQLEKEKIINKILSYDGFNGHWIKKNIRIIKLKNLREFCEQNLNKEGDI